jgi:ribonuclease HI
MISDSIKEEWRWILSNIHRINGSPIWHPSQVWVLKADASDDGWGASLMGQEQAGGIFSEVEKRWHIMFKEMAAVLHSIRAFKPLLIGRRLALKTDNVTVVAYLEKGGGQWKDLNTMVKTIWEELATVGATLTSTEWIRGSTENQEADQISRRLDCGDWMLNKEIFLQLNNMWALTVDRFACDYNSQLPRFNSRLWCKGTEAVDCFGQDWSQERNYWLPPLGLIHRVIRQVIEQRAAGLIIVPRWVAQPWWPILGMITVKVTELGFGSEIFIKSRSGKMEPTMHGDWIFEARWINGALTKAWD